MDKEQVPLARLAIREQFTHVIYRTIAILILRDIDALKEEFLKKNMYTTEDDFWLKCAEGRFKKHVTQKINSINVQKEDIVAQVMKSYGMTTFDDATDYHDLMMNICNEAIEVARLYVKAGRYDGISLMSAMSIDDKGIRFA